MLKQTANILVALLALTAASAFADEESVRKAFQPDSREKVISVAKTPYSGLWVVIGNQLVYTDDKVKFMFVGSVLDAKTLQNLTEQRALKHNAGRFASLPLDLAFKSVKGNGKRTLAVFSDPRCPYCKRLEKDPDRDNRRNGVHLPLSYPRRIGILGQGHLVCAGPAEGLGRPDAAGNQPAAGGNCETPIARVMELGQQMRVSGTPTSGVCQRSHGLRRDRGGAGEIPERGGQPVKGRSFSSRWAATPIACPPASSCRRGFPPSSPKPQKKVARTAPRMAPPVSLGQHQAVQFPAAVGPGGGEKHRSALGNHSWIDRQVRPAVSGTPRTQRSRQVFRQFPKNT